MRHKNESSTRSNHWVPDRRASDAAAFFLLFASVLIMTAILPSPALGETAAEIQAKIDEQTQKIAALEKEIAQYEAELNKVGTQKKTLQTAVDQLDLSRKKISTTISTTETKIKQTSYEIDKLSGSISEKERHIAQNTETVRSAFRMVSKIDDTTLAESILSAQGFEQAWTEIDNLRELQRALQVQITDLVSVKQELTVDRSETQKQKDKLSALKRDLAAQKKVLDDNRKEQATLLSETKNKESNYQAILKQKQEAKALFERQLSEYESRLSFNLDPTTIPKAGSGVLSFPFETSYMTKCKDKQSTYKNIYCLTQYFGNTEFAQSGAYNGKGHNGVDFGAPQGTKIVSALSGVIQATGNTDLYKGCYSYGKWILVKHSNGLATLYSHLSTINVDPGEAVVTGGLLGYSGQTGYATGPHLHFTVYVSDAVKVVRYGDVNKSTNCPNAMIPVAATEAYLNPMLYL